LPIILLFQKIRNSDRKILQDMFKKKDKNHNDLDYIFTLIKKNKIINECYQKAQHFINLASNSLTVFKDSKEKNIFKNLTSFILTRDF